MFLEVTWSSTFKWLAYPLSTDWTYDNLGSIRALESHISLQISVVPLCSGVKKCLGEDCSQLIVFFFNISYYFLSESVTLYWTNLCVFNQYFFYWDIFRLCIIFVFLPCRKDSICVLQLFSSIYFRCTNYFCVRFPFLYLSLWFSPLSLSFLTCFLLSFLSLILLSFLFPWSKYPTVFSSTTFCILHAFLPPSSPLPLLFLFLPY